MNYKDTYWYSNNFRDLLHITSEIVINKAYLNHQYLLFTTDLAAGTISLEQLKTYYIKVDKTIAELLYK